MGVDVCLRDEFGQALDSASVSDEKGWIARFVKGISQDEFPFVGSIDLYGDTMFNRKQMPQFLREWQQLSQQVQSSEQRIAYDAVEVLARRCGDGVHLQLWFVGD